MTSIRKFWWAGLALAAFAGCAEESTTTTASAPDSIDRAGAGDSSGGVPAPTTDAKDAPKPDMKDDAKPEPKDAEKADAPSKPDAPKVDAPKIDAPKPDADPKADNAKFSDDQLAAIKTLPADDQALALKQIVCPVGGENLGEMGPPIKVTAAGKTFFLCCKSCQKEVDADPKAVVAKLKN